MRKGKEGPRLRILALREALMGIKEPLMILE